VLIVQLAPLLVETIERKLFVGLTATNLSLPKHTSSQLPPVTEEIIDQALPLFTERITREFAVVPTATKVLLPKHADFQAPIVTGEDARAQSIPILRLPSLVDSITRLLILPLGTPSATDTRVLLPKHTDSQLLFAAEV
jgi:hypothetical protein